MNLFKREKITHTLVTVTGDRIDCYESVELLSDEDIIVVAKVKVDGKTQLLNNLS